MFTNEADFNAHVADLSALAGDGDWGRKYARQGSRPTRALRFLLAEAQGFVCPRTGEALDMDVTDPRHPEFPDVCHIVAARPLGSQDDRRGYIPGNIYVGKHYANMTAVAHLPRGAFPIETFDMFARPDLIPLDWNGHTMSTIARDVRNGLLDA